MKSTSPKTAHFMLAAGAVISLAALPLNASAQADSGYMRPGAIVRGQSTPVQPQAPVQMRSGAIVRGTPPIYRPAPLYNAPVYSNAPVYGRGPVSVQQPVYGRGGSTTYYGNGYWGNPNGGGYSGNGYGNGNYSGRGPVVTLPSEPYYPSGGAAYGQVYLPPVGPANGFTHNPIPPVGPGNGYFTNPIPPIGPANGFFRGQAPIIGGGPALLGGYYYGNYCNVYAPNYSYRSLYSGYSGFPQYIYSTNVIVEGNTEEPDYSTPYLPFYTPVYQTTYNQNNYYVATPERVQELQAGGEQAKAALDHAYPANSFQAAFADIAHAWTDGNIDLVRNHLHDSDTRISVFLNSKYSYSIASNDFSQITRDALDKLHTVSFNFTRLRKAKNGDVTAYGAHVYRGTDPTNSTADTGTVPFDQSGADPNADGTTLGAAKTVYVSYTLRRFGSEWDIIATDSSNHDLAASSGRGGA